MKNKKNKKIIFENKKAMSKVLGIYWFAILFLVAAGVVYMVFIFYSGNYDVRNLEANILINKIADCVSEKNILKPEVHEDFDLLEECHLNFSTEDFKDWRTHEQYIFGAELYDAVESEGGFDLSFNKKILDFPDKDDLFFICGEENVDKFVGGSGNCVVRYFLVSDSSRKYFVKILGGVKKFEKNE